MIDELLNSANAQNNQPISLDLLEQVTGIKKEVIKAELGITTDEVAFSDFKEKVSSLTQDTFLP